MRVPFHELQQTIAIALHRAGVPLDRAERCAALFAGTTRDGVYTHGLNRLPRLLAMIANGSVVPANEAALVSSTSALERWDGHQGLGNLNAEAAMDRAMQLAEHYGVACVALRNTNHWMRGGTYGWQAAEKGFFAICWTNTNPNTPAWGTTSSTLGNNPIVFAAPRVNAATGRYAGGPHTVLDMATSQYSYGQIDAHIARGQQLAVPGGFDSAGNLTHDPVAIRESYRALPIGFWKGSGLAMMLDLFAAMLSGGTASHQISVDPVFETNISQMFFCIAPDNAEHATQMTSTIDALLQAVHTAPRSEPEKRPRYPGEETLRLREENDRLGVPVDDAVWADVKRLAQ